MVLLVTTFTSQTPEHKQYFVLDQQNVGAFLNKRWTNFLLAESQLFGCRNGKNWFKISHWLQNQPTNCFDGKKAVSVPSFDELRTQVLDEVEPELNLISDL